MYSSAVFMYPQDQIILVEKFNDVLFKEPLTPYLRRLQASLISSLCLQLNFELIIIKWQLSAKIIPDHTFVDDWFAANH